MKLKKIILTAAAVIMISALSVSAFAENPQNTAQITAVRLERKLAKAAAPTSSAASGTYTSSKTITLSSKTAGAVIYYTTNGKTPTQASTKYTSAINLAENTTLKIRAYKSGYTASAVKTYTYKIKVSAPAVSVKAGTYDSEQKVTITSKTKDARIYYTTDKTAPTNKSTLYTGPITISKPETIKAVAYKNNMTASAVKEFKYVINAKETADQMDFTNCAGYLACNDKQKQLYKQIYDSVISYKDKIDISVDFISTDDFSLVFCRVDRDNPQLLQFPYKYSCSFSQTSGYISSAAFSYLYTKAETEKIMAKAEKRADEIIALANKELSLFEKIKTIYDQIILNADYNGSLKSAHVLSGVLVDGQGVCESYSRAFQYICKKINIPCILVCGYTTESHMWNQIQLDGKWYNVDLTFGDPVFGSNKEKYKDYVSYNYLNITDQQLAKDHNTYIVVGNQDKYTDDSNCHDLPDCVDTKYNYFTYYGIEIYSSLEKADVGIYKQLEEAYKNKAKQVKIYSQTTAVRDQIIDKYISKRAINDIFAKLNETSDTKFTGLSCNYTNYEITLGLNYN